LGTGSGKIKKVCRNIAMLRNDTGRKKEAHPEGSVGLKFLGMIWPMSVKQTPTP
jgi:hypothetical protein